MQRQHMDLNPFHKTDCQTAVVSRRGNKVFLLHHRRFYPQSVSVLCSLFETQVSVTGKNLISSLQQTANTVMENNGIQSKTWMSD